MGLKFACQGGCLRPVDVSVRCSAYNKCSGLLLVFMLFGW